MILNRNMTFFEIRLLNVLKLLSPVLAVSLFMLSIMATDVNAQASFPRDTLSVQTETQSYDFDVELALDDSHRQYGLMFRDSLPEMSGMLFVYDRKRDLSMWMKNTFIPLDILFIDGNGKIMNIAKSAQPRSISIIRSKREAKAVLELNGGLTDKLGIGAGDRIIYSTFKNTEK